MRFFHYVAMKYESREIIIHLSNIHISKNEGKKPNLNWCMSFDVHHDKIITLFNYCYE